MFGLLVVGYLFVLQVFHFSEEFLIGSFSLFLLSFVLLYCFLLIPRFFLVTSFKLQFYFLLFWCMFDLVVFVFFKNIYFMFSFSIFPVFIIFSRWTLNFFSKFFLKLFLASTRIMHRWFLSDLSAKTQTIAASYHQMCSLFFRSFKSNLFVLIEAQSSHTITTNSELSFDFKLPPRLVASGALSYYFYNFSHFFDSRNVSFFFVPNFIDVVSENATNFYTYASSNDSLVTHIPLCMSYLKLFLKRNKCLRDLTYIVKSLSGFFFISYFTSKLSLMSSVFLSEMLLLNSSALNSLKV